MITEMIAFVLRLEEARRTGKITREQYGDGLWLAIHGETGTMTTYVNQSEMAASMGVATKTIRRSLRVLREAGLISFQGKFGTRGPQPYELHVCATGDTRDPLGVRHGVRGGVRHGVPQESSPRTRQTHSVGPARAHVDAHVKNPVTGENHEDSESPESISRTRGVPDGVPQHAHVPRTRPSGSGSGSGSGEDKVSSSLPAQQPSPAAHQPPLPGAVALEDERDESNSSKRPRDTTKDPDVQRVFKHWQTVMGHPRAQLDRKRANRIRARLKEGATPQELCRAIDGAKLDDWIMGRSETGEGRVYDGIHTILRDREQVERLIDLAEGRGRCNGDPTVAMMRVIS